ncbi:PilZ domain-containing protein [Qipengyuania spongiae]|uniref:PilZ domain-containing protein n=1 Tax=Qipengyuania spongiae TaxID=2909673 RepID=A0ABY5SUV2_9SPHN|nr:PilZ domain-containing protein [Qipengyuania spongiae]UVI38340.1 PilZ domain-containing protein [Qipengyuania spongiae]
MLPKVASLSLPAMSPDRRAADRRTCTLSFLAADEGADTIPVLVLDLSQSGMRLWSAAILEIGDRLDVVIPEIGPVSARIVRRKAVRGQYQYGAQFHAPITQGAISAALLAAPVLAGPAQNGPLSDRPAADEAPEERFSRRVRVAIFAGLGLASWAAVGAIAYGLAHWR